jgi:hypothetical protein
MAALGIHDENLPVEVEKHIESRSRGSATGD